MDAEEVVYISCLAGSIILGKYIVELRDETQRKLLSTAIGVGILLLLSGLHSLHCFFSYALGAAAMLRAHPSACHLSCFLAMFTYLLFFRISFVFGIPPVPAHCNMIQMILTLKLSGVAFEKNAAWQKLQQRELQKRQDDADQTPIEITEFDVELQDITYAEIFHYCFSYFGVLIGPFYRYRTYRDYFEMPFKYYAPRVDATLERLQSITIFAIFYFFASYMWPTSYILTDEFYEQRSFFYRLWYIWPTFFIFRMRLYGALTMAECVCCMAGFGAYPIESDPINCNGPQKPYEHIKSEPENYSYNFQTIKAHNVRGVETCATFREGMKHWNKCIQYWLAVNIYKRFPIKKYRTLATLFVSTYWHGFRPGHYLCLMAVPFYVMLEDMWDSLLRKEATGYARKLINVGFWFSKFFGYSYLFMAMQLADMNHIWRYYTSVYHIGYIFWAVFSALGIYLSKQKAAERKSKTQSQIRTQQN